MHAQIAAFPSKVMYQDKLTSHPSVASHLLKDLPNANAADEEEEKELLGTPVTFFDTAGCEYYERVEGDEDEGSRCNENEATVVKKYIGELVRMLLRYVADVSKTRPGRRGHSPGTDCSHHPVNTTPRALNEN